MVDVLIAEDDAAILDSLSFILQRDGWSITSVTDGDAALQAVRRLRPRIVVLDIMMPKRTGLEVLKHMRAEEATRDVPVLILTARGQRHDREIAEDLRANGFVTKPYSNGEVIAEVRRLLCATLN